MKQPSLIYEGDDLEQWYRLHWYQYQSYSILKTRFYSQAHPDEYHYRYAASVSGSQREWKVSWFPISGTHRSYVILPTLYFSHLFLILARQFFKRSDSLRVSSNCCLAAVYLVMPRRLLGTLRSMTCSSSDATGELASLGLLFFYDFFLTLRSALPFNLLRFLGNFTPVGVVLHFYTPVWKTDVLCYGNVRPSVRPSEFFFNMLWDINLKLGICIQ